MQILTEWLERAVNRAPEERATVAKLQVLLGDQNVCMHLDGTDSVDQVTLPLYALAAGMAQDWWRLFGGRDAEMALVDHRMGYAVPDIRLCFDGSRVEVKAHQRTYRNPDVRFWAGPFEEIPRDQAEKVLAGFVESVLARLAGKDVRGTSLEHRWARVQASRAEPDEATFCEAAGALGVDPYAINHDAEMLIEKAAALFAGEALIEFLNGLRMDLKAPAVLEWIARAEGRARYHSRLPGLLGLRADIAPRSAARCREPAWGFGYRQARAARKALNIAPRERVSSFKEIAQKLDAPGFSLAAAIDGVVAMRSESEDGVHVHLRRQGGPRAVTGHTFAFARAIGDALCFPEPGRFVVNELRNAVRQAMGRAFAAEFLAPGEEVAKLRKDGHDSATIAEIFAVAPVLVERQSENLDRIREACG